MSKGGEERRRRKHLIIVMGSPSCFPVTAKGPRRSRACESRENRSSSCAFWRLSMSHVRFFSPREDIHMTRDSAC